MKKILILISNSPHPVSFTSNGGDSIDLIGFGYVSCNLNTTFLIKYDTSSPNGSATKIFHVCE